MKKRIGVLLLALAMSIVLCTPAFAAPGTIKTAGFYDIDLTGINNITVTPTASSGAVIELDADIDGDSNYDEKFYANSDKLKVTYSAAQTNGFYGVVLVEGTGLPTVDNTIFYIDQLTAGTGGLTFDVYPILPTKTTKLTLYISSNVAGHNLIKIPLNYALKGEYAVADVPFTLGDVDSNGLIEMDDAYRALRIAAKLHTPTETEALAANVNGDSKVDVNDAYKILRYAARLISSWD